MRSLVAGVLSALMLAACAAGGGDGAATSESIGEAAAPTELRLAVGGESDEGYDPTLGWGRYGSPLFQSTLLRLDADLEVVNDLATEYAVSDDGLIWTVDIRSDALFSDGEPVTAADVAYTFNTAATSGGITDLTVLDEAVAVDDDTVELRLEEPQTTFVNRMITLGIVPAHLHDERYARSPIGSGPFTLVRWDEGQQMIVERNDDYYGQAPAFDRIVFLFTAEDATLALARSGDVHVASLPQSLANQDISGMRLVAVDSVDNRGIMLPAVPDDGEATDDGHAIGNDVTADDAIRRAVNVAVNRTALVAGILDGHGSPAVGPVDGLPWFEPASAVADSDIEAARQILEDGGWADGDGDGIVEKDGLPAEFTIVYPATDSVRQGLAVTAAQMVQPAGIRIDVEGRSWDEIETLMHSNGVLFGWGSHDQTEMYNLHHSSFRGVDFFNAGFYSSASVDSYLDLAMGATDPEEANAFWKAAQWDGDGEGFSARADAAWAWLVNLDHTYFVDDCLDVGEPQVEPHGHGFPITAGIVSWTWSC